MKILYVLSLSFFIFLGCVKAENKDLKKKVEKNVEKKVESTANTKKVVYSGKALEVTKFAVAMKEVGKKQAVMLEVGSDSCKSCKEMALMLQELKEDHPKFKVFFVDVGKERIAAKELKIQMIPTQVFFDKNGKEIYRHIGKYKTKDLIAKKLKELGFIL